MKNLCGPLGFFGGNGKPLRPGTVILLGLDELAGDVSLAAQQADLGLLAETERTLLFGEWRIGQELLLEEQEGNAAPPHRPPKGFPGGTLFEKVGNRTYGWRLR